MPEINCPHTNAPETKRVCLHLLADADADYHQRFTGVGLTYDLICADCLKRPEAVDANLRHVCAACFQHVTDEGFWDGLIGSPEVLARATDLVFDHEDIKLHPPLEETILAVQPVDAVREPVFVAVTASGALLSLDLASRTWTRLADLAGTQVDLGKPISLYVAPDGTMAAVVNTRGEHGVVIDLRDGRRTMHLRRAVLHTSRCEVTHCDYPIAFFEMDGQLLLVHGTVWNRLDVSNPRTGQLITVRPSPVYVRDSPRACHYLDYFHCRLSVSPDYSWIADHGWCWTPIGVPRVWSLRDWVLRNVWESEDGPSVHALAQTWYFWDGPLCWADEQTLILWGYGTDEINLIPAVRLFDVTSGALVRWIAGPEQGLLTFDTYLFSSSEKSGTSIWDIATGERLHHDPSLAPVCYHRGSRRFLTVLPGGAFRLSRLSE